MRPGEIILAGGPILLNAGRPVTEITVENTSDHVVWIGSHYPFFEVNKRLRFDRAMAWGLRLDIPAGDCVGWQPGETKTVQLVPFAGRQVVRGFNHLTDGLTTPDRMPSGLRLARDGGYADVPTE